MTVFFEPLIKKKQAVTYIDDTIMQSQNKGEMFSIIHEYHDLLRKTGLKAAPEKTFFFLKNLKFLEHVISSEGIQPIAKRVKDPKNPKSLECKRDVMNVLRFLGFYSCHIKTSTWRANHSTISLEILPHSIGLKNTKSSYK